MGIDYEQLRFVDLGGMDDPLWEKVLPILQELRPHLTEELLGQVLEEGTPQGLHFTALLVDGECVSVAGWRVISSTGQIRMLYVDDLSTGAAYRSKGYGAMVLEAVEQKARDLGCYTLDLDSGVGRHDAHRFYMDKRMIISSFHFRKRL